MALKELELIMGELKKLTETLKGETRPEARRELYMDMQLLFEKVHRGAQGGAQ